MYIRPRKTFILALLLIILGIHLWSLSRGAYFYIWWLDIILHFLGGFALGSIAVLALWRYEKLMENIPAIYLILIVISFAAFGGVLWEFYEFIFDFIFVKRGFAPAQLGVADTMSDLFFDLLGAFISSLFFTRRRRRDLI